jgi:PPK2 family polyphosphate:nucleotide phosphotransferase
MLGLREAVAGQGLQMKVDSPYLIGPREKVRLSRISASATGSYATKAEAASDLERHRRKLCELQELLTAEAKHAVLVVLQGMDTSGKDGTIQHIFSGINPQACNVSPFKVPTPEERKHDFLWRVHREVPAKGTIGIFNRSHYEDVLVTRVHKVISDKVARQRCKQIVAFEEGLAENNVTILKFFLHITRDEQTQRLEARMADPAKLWKLSEADFAERALWSEYQKAYQDAISHTSRPHAPWFVIPSNHKWYRNVAISKIMVDAMKGLKMEYPKVTFDPGKITL